MAAINQLIQDKERNIADIEKIIPIVTNTETIEKEIEELTIEIEIVSELLGKLVKKNAEKVQDQSVFKEKYDCLIKRLELLQERLKIIESKKQERIAKKSKMLQFIFDLKKLGEQKFAKREFTDFDESLWCMFVDSVVVNTNTKFTFNLKSGNKMEVNMN
jgi:hypothetical protein